MFNTCSTRPLSRSRACSASRPSAAASPPRSAAAHWSSARCCCLQRQFRRRHRPRAGAAEASTQQFDAEQLLAQETLVRLENENEDEDEYEKESERRVPSGEYRAKHQRDERRVEQLLGQRDLRAGARPACWRATGVRWEKQQVHTKLMMKSSAGLLALMNPLHTHWDFRW